MSCYLIPYHYGHYTHTHTHTQITELNHSPTNFRRKIFTLASPTESPVLSPTAESPVLPPTSESQPLPPASESPAFPTTSEPQALPTTSEPQAFPTTSEPQAFPTTSESPVPSESQSELSMQSLVHTPVHSPSPSPVSSRKSSSDGTLIILPVEYELRLILLFVCGHLFSFVCGGAANYNDVIAKKQTCLFGWAVSDWVLIQCQSQSFQWL